MDRRTASTVIGPLFSCVQGFCEFADGVTCILARNGPCIRIVVINREMISHYRARVSGLYCHACPDYPRFVDFATITHA